MERKSAVAARTLRLRWSPMQDATKGILRCKPIKCMLGANLNWVGTQIKLAKFQTEDTQIESSLWPFVIWLIDGVEMKALNC